VKEIQQLQAQADYTEAKARNFQKPRADLPQGPGKTRAEIRAEWEKTKSRKNEIERSLPKPEPVDPEQFNAARELRDSDISVTRSKHAQRILKQFEAKRDAEIAARTAAKEEAERIDKDPRVILARQSADGWLKLAISSGNPELIEQATDLVELAQDGRAIDLIRARDSGVSRAITSFWDEQRANAASERMRATKALIDADTQLQEAEAATEAATPPDTE
jgi:hypothetical protein